MSKEYNLGEEYLVEHYKDLDDIKKDFRNYNLFTLVSSLVEGETVVDIGSGLAFFASMLQKRGKDVRGIEPSEGMRTLARKVNPDVELIDGLAEQMDDLIKEKVDAVTMLDVLEHIEDDDAQVKRVHRALKEGGEFVIVVPAHPSLHGKRDVAMGHFRRYSRSSLEKVLTENGFYIEKMRSWNVLGFLPYFILEKVFKTPLQVKALREGSKPSFFGNMVRKALHLWFKLVENNISFGFGLSLICVARKG